jgi:hypothetical protein
MTADDENRVVGVQRTIAERNGKRLEVGNCIVFELNDGRITEVRETFLRPLRLGRVLGLGLQPGRAGKPLLPFTRVESPAAAGVSA